VDGYAGRAITRRDVLTRIVDLSQEIYQGMPVYAGHLGTKVWQHHRFEDTAPNFDSDFAYQSLGIVDGSARRIVRDLVR
jgi:hypothetical protein